MSAYDVIVLGVGGVGAATCWQLAQRGVQVLGIDRFAPGHDRGSSHGESRIIRQAYFEHPDYVPLLRRTYELWHDIETQSQQTLYFPVGLLEIGPADGVVVPGVLESARKYGVPVETLSAHDIAQRFPGFRLPAECTAVFEPQAGYLLVEAAVQAQAELAAAAGTTFKIGETVLAWQALDGGVKVTTDRAVYHAAKLVITGGAWASDLLGDLGLHLRVLRKHLYWYATSGKQFRRAANSPAFLYELPHGVFYGISEVQPGEIKVGEHSGGAVVADPLHDPRKKDEADCQRVTEFVSTQLIGVSTAIRRHVTCFYTMSPDENFLVDCHPQHPAVVFAAGLSGHGFKFTPVLGEVLADLAINGCTTQPIDFLSVKRFGS